MAKIGLKNFRWSRLTEAEDGTPSYDGAHTMGKAIDCNVSITSNSATLYADDGLAESDTSFQSGTVTMGVDEDADNEFAPLLGHTIEDGEIIRNADDTAPYVGIGRIITKMVSGVYKYKVEILYKVKFSEPSQENTTKGESLEFGTTSIEGMVSKLANGNWSKAKTFTTYNDALTYLNNAFSHVAVTGVSVSPATATVAENATTNLTATVFPSNATNKEITWSSSDDTVATVTNEGVVTGVSDGTAIITATTTDGAKTDICMVTVTA